MLKVGLTGSIAVGKSTVAKMLGELGCRILDADVVAREVVEPGTAGLRAISEHFGEKVLSSEGRLDRKALAEIVFNDEDQREVLNAIVHPLVLEQQDLWFNEVAANDPEVIAVIEAALMIESGGYKRFDRLIVAWCDPRIQFQRLLKRNGNDIEDASQRIGSQMSQEQKKSYADFLIDTSGDLSSTRQKVKVVFDKLLLLSKAEAR